MDSRIFDYFEAIERTGSYAKAAKELYVTPQGISGAVKRLESSLGVPLVYGRADNLQFTDYGCVFAKYARVAKDALDAMEVELRELEKAHSGELTLGSAIGLTDYLPADFEDDYSATHEGSVRLIEVAGDYVCEERLLAGVYDYALLNRPVDNADIREMPLYSDFLFAWVSADDALASKEALSAADLRGRTMVYLSGEFRTSSAFLDYCAAIPGAEAVLVDEMIEVLQRAIAGQCVAVTTRPHAEGIRIEGLRGVPISDLRWGFSLCCRADRVQLAADEDFVAYLRQFEKFYV